MHLHRDWVFIDVFISELQEWEPAGSIGINSHGDVSIIGSGTRFDISDMYHTIFGYRSQNCLRLRQFERQD